jgi:rSAM/selenodomain-associated transferase 1
MRRALLIVGKAPEPGRTKTRLVPPLSAADAAALYAGFLQDSVEVGLDLRWEHVAVVHPRASGPPLRRLLPSAVRLLEQPGHGLQDALAFAFATHFGLGFDRVVLVGSDNPTLPRSAIEAACAALDSHDVAIGPTTDGGYYLLGLRAPHVGLFDNIAWSTSVVAQQTLERAASLGLSTASVTEWYDVDEPADLDRLQRDLQVVPATVAPHTRAALARLTPVAVPLPG